ncbi:MAG: spore germination protein GerW family protein [Methanomicrobiaceae archaeon]|nr:spore germination protein GerW family protein [Methanomicrobiaceae archaeon]
MAGEMLKITTDVLERMLSANTIVGDAVDAGDKTFIPVAGFGFGFGSAEGEGTGKGKEGEGSGQGGGSGAGGGINPVAVIILHKEVKGLEGVQVISLKKTSMLAEVVGTVGEEVLPHLMNVMKEKMGELEKTEGKEIKISEEGETAE